MNRHLPPHDLPEDDDATGAQLRAAAPERSSWVAANAGSGKTRVLTDRVARLLLARTEPHRILCLTYTKAAAAEMQGRLFRTLGTWAMAEDDELRERLQALGTPAEAWRTEAGLGAARTLFARALETPGGLKIQTIHAFCEALLRRFPLEAGVAPGFRVLDDRAAKALRGEILNELAEAEPELIAELSGLLTGDDPDPFLKEIGSRRGAFAGPFDRTALAHALGITPDLTIAALAAPLLDAQGRSLLQAAVAVAIGGSASDQKLGARLAAALAAPDPIPALAELEGALLKKDGTGGRLFTKALSIAHPDLAADLRNLAEAVETARAQRLAIATLAKAGVLHRFARAWLAALDARKARGGLLDFDDMIDRSRKLLADPATAAWVLWKLDGGIDHILVDEAQDTSPAQWEVIRALSDEFFAGEGARPETLRTVFVVGDEKQSIYSFQGADPEAFGSMRRYYEARIGELGAELQRCALIHSFRSARPVLELVDAVFAGPAGAGLDTAPTHRAFNTGLPGRVELWPFRPQPDKVDEGPWWQPVDQPGPGDPVEALAARLATTIRGWLDEGRRLPGTDRAVRAGDVMILVQQRSGPFNAIIRALKRAGVPVAGADVLRLGGDLAVKDLLAALRVVSSPVDDLSLAAFLRSPMGGLSEEALFTLAHGRRGTLMDALRALPPGEIAGPRALLADLAAQADFLRPFELLQRMLIRHDGRRQLIARLGAEAEDGIDALLDAALAYEQAEAPSLGGFLAWIDQDEMQVKRRADESADEVRVMTVHGAKGLEAEIVILPDTGERQEGRNAPEILTLDGGHTLWRMRSAETPPVAAAAEAARRDRARAENMRLLYVGLTRARRWLIVCGAGAAPKPGGHAWHGLVAAAMARLAAATESTPEGEIRVMSHLWEEGGAAAVAPMGPVEPAEGRGDGRLDRLPTAPRFLRPLSPSGLGGSHVVLRPDAPGAAPEDEAEREAAAKARGEALHRLLELLHAAPVAERAVRAARLLPDVADLADLLAEAERVIDDPAFAALFGAGSRAEVDITAPLAALGGGTILGRVDRLLVTPARILAVDFKSNRVVPAWPEAVPEGILRQMGAYRAALAAIWPDRPVETAILWTRTPLLMALPDALVDAALARGGQLQSAGGRSR